MNLTDNEVRTIIEQFYELADWWELDEGAKVGPIELMEKNDDATYNSYDGYNCGDRSMVLKLGGDFYKIAVYYDSYSGLDWKTSATIKKVKPVTRSVSYYE